MNSKPTEGRGTGIESPTFLTKISFEFSRLGEVVYDPKTIAKGPLATLLLILSLPTQLYGSADYHKLSRVS